MKWAWLLNKWVMAAIALFALVVQFFVGALFEHGREAMKGGASPVVLADSQVGLVKGYRLAPLHNNPSQVHAKNIRLVARDRATRVFAVDLVSDTADNDYPTMEVTLQRADGGAARVVDVGPDEYAHGHELSDEEIRLQVQVSEGESRAEITPVYRTARGAGGA